MSMYNVCECVRFNSSLKSLSQMKTKFTWDHHGIGEKINSNDSGQLLFFIFILSASGGGGFYRGFYHKFGPAVQGF